MDLTLDQLNKDKTQLNADILKLIKAFQGKYDIDVYNISMTENRPMEAKFSEVIGINVEIRL